MDVGIVAGKARQEPVLALAAIAPFPQLADQVVGQVVKHFLARLGDQGDVAFLHPGFFPQLAQRGFAQVFAIIDSALRHLPVDPALVGLAAGVDPATDKGLAGRVDHHHANAGTVGQVGKGIAHPRALSPKPRRSQTFISISFIAAITLAVAAAALGRALRVVEKSWVRPCMCRNSVSTPASTSLAAIRRP